jgi:transcriptional regulator with XRE-family HTH domain
MANPIDKAIGARIQLRRKQLGLSHVEAAEAAKIDPFTLRRFEAGTTRVTARQMLALCEAFRAPPSYFLLGECLTEGRASAGSHRHPATDQKRS